MAVFRYSEVFERQRVDVWGVVGAVTGTDNKHLLSQEIVSGQGLGMVRRCVDTDGKEWTESCSVWLPGEAYRFDVAVEEHPLPMRQMSAEVRAADAGDHTEVTVLFDYRSRLGPLIDQLAKLALRKIARENFATWRQQLAESQPEEWT